MVFFQIFMKMLKDGKGVERQELYSGYLKYVRTHTCS